MSTEKLGTAESLDKAIDTHKKMLTEALKSSELIAKYANEGDEERAAAETENRKRLINVVTYIQNRIERSVKAIPQSVYNDKITQTLNDWQSFLAESIEKISRLDQEALESLAQLKNETSQEIANNFKQKVGHKGYDLKNTKR